MNALGTRRGAVPLIWNPAQNHRFRLVLSLLALPHDGDTDDATPRAFDVGGCQGTSPPRYYGAGLVPAP